MYLVTVYYILRGRGYIMIRSPSPLSEKLSIRSIAQAAALEALLVGDCRVYESSSTTY